MSNPFARLCILLVGMAASVARAQTAAPRNDAAEIYARAAKVLSDDDNKNIMAPAASNLEYREYPPMPDEWLAMEKQDYEAHQQVREMMHQAASLDHAAWSKFAHHNGSSYLNHCRNLANEIADAALYQSLILKDQPAAFESARDLMHLADLLKSQPPANLVQLLVADGIESLDLNRLMVMLSGAAITEDPRDTHDLQLSTAKDWIVQLLNHPEAQAELDQVMKAEPAPASTDEKYNATIDRVRDVIRRQHCERDLTAMAFAAHVYQHKHNRWPASLEELKSELPRLPIDPWGDGKQPVGYMLVKAGLPDGTDRPLVYSRYHSNGGLSFPTDEPKYSFYSSESLKLQKSPTAQQKQFGQFRDITRWAPPKPPEIKL
jgi:hypothetical protein